MLAVELCRAGGYPVRITVVYRAIFTGFAFGIRSARASRGIYGERSRGRSYADALNFFGAAPASTAGTALRYEAVSRV